MVVKYGGKAKRQYVPDLKKKRIVLRGRWEERKESVIKIPIRRFRNGGI